MDAIHPCAKHGGLLAILVEGLAGMIGKALLTLWMTAMIAAAFLYAGAAAPGMDSHAFLFAFHDR
jgi:hypothetical protein